MVGVVASDEELWDKTFPLPGGVAVGAGDLTHAPPSGPDDPALHVQAVIVILPAGESEFAGQLWHLAFPLVALYVAATHWVHNCPLSPENPWLHMQSISFILAAGDMALVGHLLQAPLPVASLYVPSSQAKQF